MSFPTAALPYSITVQFGGSQTPTFGPNVLTIKQCEFAHDLAIMQIWADDVDADSYTSGMPMTLTFGRPGTKRIFYGYVNHASRTNNNLANMSLTDRNSTWITCVGASWYLKQAGTQVFSSQTASQIVQTVASQFNLDANIVPHSTVWPTIQMAGMTYWQLCCMLAKRIGYTFYCSGVQLVFKPRQTNPSNIVGLTATYDYRTNPGSLPIFTPTLGATSPAGGQLANRRLGGVDARTNQIIFAQISGNPSPTVLGNVVNNPVFDLAEHDTASTQQEVNAKTIGSAQSNQLYITATAQATGSPMISQGSLISVVNANGSQNGLWFVTEAKHHFDNKAYITDFCVGRDSLGASAAPIAGVIQIASPPTAQLMNNKWVAA